MMAHLLVPLFADQLIHCHAVVDQLLKLISSDLISALLLSNFNFHAQLFLLLHELLLRHLLDLLRQELLFDAQTILLLPLASLLVQLHS